MGKRWCRCLGTGASHKDVSEQHGIFNMHENFLPLQLRLRNHDVVVDIEVLELAVVDIVVGGEVLERLQVGIQPS